MFMCYFVYVEVRSRFSFLHVDPGSEILAIKLGGEWLYPLSHLASNQCKDSLTWLRNIKCIEGKGISWWGNISRITNGFDNSPFTRTFKAFSRLQLNSVVGQLPSTYSTLRFNIWHYNYIKKKRHTSEPSQWFTLTRRTTRHFLYTVQVHKNHRRIFRFL